MIKDLGKVLTGDCLDHLADLPDESVDMVYMDPPFNTGRVQSGTDPDHAYADDFGTTGQYIEFLKPRIIQVHRVLKPTGSIMLHCDWRNSHHVRLLLDRVFGEDNFINHVIWSYGLGGSSPRRFARKHDDILFYGRTDQYWFDPPRIPATSRRMQGRTKKATDVLDIPSLNNMASERTGYPTQKPLQLLRMLVQSAAPPGGIVLDPFCGSGTTLVAAIETGRRWMGFDISPDAVTMSITRCNEAGDVAANSRGQVVTGI
ncbi:MAG: hypothetical protein CMJ32_03140 [Phycisphaerae bacterium]|nr:hypothetical protein [Phycisphaerae bacterium]